MNKAEPGNIIGTFQQETGAKTSLASLKGIVYL